MGLVSANLSHTCFKDVHLMSVGLYEVFLLWTEDKSQDGKRFLFIYSLFGYTTPDVPISSR